MGDEYYVEPGSMLRYGELELREVLEYGEVEPQPPAPAAREGEIRKL